MVNKGGGRGGDDATRSVAGGGPTLVAGHSEAMRRARRLAKWGRSGKLPFRTDEVEGRHGRGGGGKGADLVA